MQQGTISPLDCDMQWKVDFKRQPAMVQWLVGLRSSIEPPKAKLAPKNDHGHCLVVCCPSGPLQLSESWRNHYIWELCPANEWDATPAAGTGQQNGPNSSPQQHPTCHTTNTSKLNELDYEVLLHPSYSPDLSPTNFLFFKHLNFLQAKHSHNQQEAANAFQECRIPRHGFLCYRNKQTYFLLSKCVDCNNSYFNLKRCIWA